MKPEKQQKLSLRTNWDNTYVSIEKELDILNKAFEDIDALIDKM